MTYILIYEDGTFYQADELTEEHYDSFGSGILTIINRDNMTYMYDVDCWTDIEKER